MKTTANIILDLDTPVFIYIIAWAGIKRFYVGSTINIEKRMIGHKNNKKLPNRKMKVSILYKTTQRYRYKWESWYFWVLFHNEIRLFNRAFIYDFTYTSIDNESTLKEKIYEPLN